jgi:hypothetical protein|tara:strand:+ start:2010 stop:2462 length:453 start_codon:yes stop_codon:yes gene_type:complete
MASTYRTARKKIVDSLVKQLKGVNGIHPYNSNLFNNVHGNMIFLDQIQEYPKVCVVAGDETRQYQPGEFKWRFLQVDIRVYVSNQEDSQEALAVLMEDIERVIDDNDILIYDDTVSPNLTTTSLTLLSLSTDEGVLAPLGIGEMVIECRY